MTTTSLKGLFKGRPTAVGLYQYDYLAPEPGDADYFGGQVETLLENGWRSIEKHPADPCMHSCLGTDAGMLTLGGIHTHDRNPIQVWILDDKTSQWRRIGRLNYESKLNTVIQLNGEIFVWSGDSVYLGYSQGGSRHLERLNWHGENLTSTAIRRDTHFCWSPIILDVDIDFCMK